MATAEGKKHRIGMAEFQRFGGAMLTPVLFFMFSGIVVAVTSVLTNPMLVGEIANEGTAWNGFWNTVANGGWDGLQQHGDPIRHRPRIRPVQ